MNVDFLNACVFLLANIGIYSLLQRHLCCFDFDFEAAVVLAAHVCLCVCTKTEKLLMRNWHNLVGICVVLNPRSSRF